jgi:hypothetical protein
MIKKTFLIFLISLLCACVSYSSQYNALTSTNDEAVDLSDYIWTVDIDNTITEVYPITLDTHTAFANRGGWIIQFNGWEIFQLIMPEQVDDIYNFSETTLVVTGTHNYQMSCSPWQDEQIDGGIKHNKHCSNQYTTIDNYLIVNELGETIEIHQFISDDLGYLNLRKL